MDQIVFNTFYMVLSLQIHDHQKLLSSSKVQILSIKIDSFKRKSNEMTNIMSCFVQFCRESNYQLRLDNDENCLMFIYPVYNALVSENAEVKSPKDR